MLYRGECKARGRRIVTSTQPTSNAALAVQCPREGVGIFAGVIQVGVRALLAVLLLWPLACGGKAKTGEDARSEPGAVVPASGPFATLAGTWTGTADLPGYGTVIATAILDARGQGQYFVTVSGAKRQGAFRVLAWDTSYLLVESEGHEERIHATLKGNALWIDNAFIGQVRLDRLDQ